MTTKEHHGRRHSAGHSKAESTGMFGRLFSSWLGRPDYDWGCGPIDLAGLESVSAKRNRWGFRLPLMCDSLSLLVRRPAVMARPLSLDLRI
ncbi:hypothetical protein, partial [Mycoplana rhizolycopersici]|uniref:hypothetical protein n=1 Tax=Mycoplana rhizolycopersici TaxID=2746702 RepID=UPI001AEF3286